MIFRMGLAPEGQSFDELISASIHQFSLEKINEIRENKNRNTFLYNGIYSHYLESWVNTFGLERIKVIISEELFATPQRVLDEVHAFLGVEPFQYKNLPVYNKGGYNQEISEETIETMRNFYRPFNQQLSEMLGRPIPWD